MRVSFWVQAHSDTNLSHGIKNCQREQDSFPAVLNPHSAVKGTTPILCINYHHLSGPEAHSKIMIFFVLRGNYHHLSIAQFSWCLAIQSPFNTHDPLNYPAGISPSHDYEKF